MAETTYSQTVQDSVSSLYIAFFGRAPDANGFNYWCRELSPPTNASPFKIAADFALSPEWQNTYGSLTDPAAQVNLFYQNTFGRNADAGGLAYWVAEIDGGLAFSSVAYQIVWAAYLGGPNVNPFDNAIVINKIAVSEYFATELASNDTVVAKTAFFDVTPDPATVPVAEARLDEEVETKTVNVTVAQAEDLPAGYSYNLYDTAANLLAAPAPVLNDALSATITGGGVVAATTISYLVDEVPGTDTVNASGISGISGTTQQITDLLAQDFLAPVNFNSVLNGVAVASQISAIKVAGGTGTINGAALTAINGTAAAVVQALAAMATDPTTFNSTLTGVAQAADIASIAAANGEGTINGAGLTAINGTAAAVLQALADMATDPTSFSSALTGVALATDITTLAAISGMTTINGAAITAINGAADDVLLAYPDLDTLPTSFTSTITDTTATAADLNAVRALSPAAPTSVNIAQVQTVNLAVTSESFDVTNFTYESTGFVINGGAGNDTIIGGINNDTITGGAGNDILEGGDGDDILVFANGNELAGDAVVSGGNGIDTVRIDSGSGDLSLLGEDFANVVEVEILDLTGTGRQAVSLFSFTDDAFVSGITIRTNIDALSLDLQGAASTVSINATGTNNADTLIGGSANDTLNGGAGNDTITGGAGADQLNAGAGANVITDAGVGADSVTHDSASSTVAIAVTGTDTVSITATELGATATAAASGNRTIDASTSTSTGGLVINGAALISGQNGVYTGGAGADTITGGAGNDVLTGGDGNDRLTGGTGVDTFNVNVGVDTITDLGVGGQDVLVVVGATANANATIGQDYIATNATRNTGGTATLTSDDFDVDLSQITGGDAGFTIDASTSSTRVALTGSAWNDTITGGSGNDSLTGGLGVDTFNVGLSSTDYIFDLGVGGQDVLVVTTGATAQASVGADYVATVATTNTSGTATLSSGSYDVDLTLVTSGNAGFTINAGFSSEDLTLKGSAWNDTITSGSGNDTLTGGTGADQLNAGAGTNVITDAGVGADVISHIDSSSTVAIAVTGSDTVTLNATQLGATATATAGGNRTINASTSDAAGAVVINGSSLITGQNGNYTGGAGADTITGGDGNDTITGGTGADVINAGAGTNAIIGAGLGADVIAHNSASSTVSIAVTGSDTVTLNATQLGATATATAGGNRTINASTSDAAGAVVINGSSLITGQNGNYTGGAGADTITGGAGNDTISGGAGTDVINAGGGTNFIIGAGLGADVITHNSASSTVSIAVTGSDTVTLSATQLGATATTSAGGNRTINASTSDAVGTVVINGAALIAGQNGDYTGGAGADTITGGSGNDTITGGTGADMINAGAGSNVIIDAGVGADVITHNSVSSTVSIAVTDTASVTLNATQLGATATATAGGNRTINATNSDAVGAVVIDGTALIAGQAGFYLGGAGADSLTGGAGNDTINGNAGNDIIAGGAGNDVLIGGIGNDTLIFTTSAELGGDLLVMGGDGTDTIRLNSGAVDVILENSDFSNVQTVEILNLAGTGRQSVALGANTNSAFATGITITTEATARSLNLKGEASTVSINATGTNNADTLVGGSANDTITGGAGADVINAGAGTNVITDAGVGTDAITHNQTASTVAIAVTGTGVVTLTASQLGASASSASGVNTTINASTSTFGVTLNGSSGNDSLSGGSAADTVSGGSGNDMITGGAGADSLTGGDGNDVFRFISGDELGEDVLVQGDGGANSIEITAADLTIVDADFTDVRNIQTLVLTGASTVVLDVAAFAAGITNVTTGAGATSIKTNATVAAVSINAAALADDTALALEGFNSAAFTVTALSGDIVTNGVTGTLTVTTAAVANSSIETAEGATTISGLATAVSVDAADLVDSSILTLNNATNYTVTNLEGNVVAGGSTGTLNIALDDVNVNVASIGAGTGNVTVTGGAATDIVTVTGLGTVGQVFTATAALSSFNVTGGAGAQSITGGSGSDTITGGAGNDTITGGAGNDKMTGGSDADTFDITTTAADTDRISDWGLGADVLAGSAFAGQQLNVTIVNTSTTAFNAATAFDTNGAVSVTGGSGNDTITGGVGADTITGGNGNDIITGGAGADSLIGGDGNDLFLFNTGDIVTGEVINGGEDVNTLRVVTSTNLSEVTSIEKVDYFQVTDSTTVTALGSQLHMAPINVNGFGGGGVSTAHIDVVGVDVVDLSNITFTASGTGTAFISGTDIIDIDGDEANNTITGTTLADNIAGNGGDDTLLGGAGNDTINGGSGNDMITGGAGADVISVAFASGSDTLVYAAMTDTLNSTTAFVNGLTVTDADIITGFYLGDMVDLSALAIDIESGPLGSGFASNLSVDALNLIKGTWSGTTFTASIEGVDYLLQIVESSGTATNAGVVFDNVGSNMVALWNSVTETITLYDTYYPT